MDVLTTHYNQSPTLEPALESITTQLGGDDRLVVVDAGSDDGSYGTLESAATQPGVRLHLDHDVSRGRGRQLALERSTGEVVMAHLDFDTVFAPVLQELRDYYTDLVEDRGPGLLLVHGGMVATREFLETCGGWHDLQVHEDKDLWVRAAREGRLYHLPISIVERHRNADWTSWRYRLRRRYYNYREAIRLGIPAETLAASRYHHASAVDLPDRTLFAVAVRRAGQLSQFDVLDGGQLDPAAHFLRELTYPALADAGLLEVERLEVPPELSAYATRERFPGQTSYQ